MKSQVICLWTGFAILLAGAATAVAEVEELSAAEIGSPQRIEVFPTEIQLDGPRAQAQLVVTGIYSDGRVQDLTRVAELSSGDPAILDLRETRAHSVGNGSTTLSVRVGGQERKLVASVQHLDRPQPVSFQHGVLPALSKQGCNAGACHGSPSGKGGFRLSLRAFDPKLDQLTLIHENFGRRINPLEPAQSLLLLKPLMKVPHGGGSQLKNSHASYEVLHDWIAEGGQVDPPETPRCVRIEVHPPSGRVLHYPAHVQQLAVIAHFADGSQKDITPLAVFSSSDESVASVDRDGLVVSHDRGETAVIVRYLEHIESSFLTFVRPVDGFEWKAPPTHNYIDELVDAKLQQLQYLPSDVCSDVEFLRRVYLDVIGIPPTPDEVSRFLEDPAENKRAGLIDELLDRPEYSKFWALKWGDLLRMTSKQVGDDGVHKYHRWVERSLADNTPYDQFARELLTAVGSTLSNPPANFYRTATDATDCVETISQIFLGARLQCAKCHNHPFEKWTQDNYYGMAAFFNRVQRKKTPRPDDLFVWIDYKGEVTQPRTGQIMQPWVPGHGTFEKADVDDRRELFANWLTTPDNPFFAKIEVNRIWSQLFGRGIVEPPDDFRESNPPSNAALLNQLAKDFAENGFDRKHLMRRILNSRTYQTSFETNPFNVDDVKYFSHYEPRLLSAEQLLDAICQATGVEEPFKGLPPGTKATHLPAPDLVNNEFLKIFGQPERQTVCECERTSDSNLGMAIQFFNGELIYNKIRDGNNRFRQLVESGNSDEEVIAALYLAAVSRTPSSAEIQASLQHVADKDLQIAARNKEIEAQQASLQQEISGVRRTFREQLVRQKLQAVPEAIRGDLLNAVQAAPEKRSEVQKYLAEKLGSLIAVADDAVTAALDDPAKQKIAEAEKQLVALKDQIRAPGDLRIEALEDICWAILNTNEFLFQH